MRRKYFLTSRIRSFIATTVIWKAFLAHFEVHEEQKVSENRFFSIFAVWDRLPKKNVV